MFLNKFYNLIRSKKIRKETNMIQVAQNPVVMFDALAYVRHLRNAGISDKESDGHAEALTDAFRGTIVTN